MIEDIIFQSSSFIMEIPFGEPGGQIESFITGDSNIYDYIKTKSETSHIFIN